MAVAEEALFATLSAAAPVTAVVGQRIYPDVIPQDAGIPAIAFLRTDTEFINTIHGAAPVGATPLIEISCVQTSRELAHALANLVTTAIATAGFTIEGRRSEQDPETGLWATVLNVTFDE